MRLMQRPLLHATCAALLLMVSAPSFALFDDNEARKAIIDLRQQVNVLEQRLGQRVTRLETVTEGQLTLAQQLAEKDREIAKLRGDLEVANNAIKKLQDDNRVLYTSLEKRIAQLEPKKVEMDGQQMAVPQDQYGEYQAALDTLKAGNFAQAATQLQAFLARYPKNTLEPQARYYLGSAQFAQGDYKAALVTQRDLAKDYPDHPRAPDALLSMASAQLELKAIPNAKKTLTEIVSKYPGTPAASSAKARLDALK